MTAPQQTLESPDGLAGQSLRVQRLVRRFVRLFKCDTARITSPMGKHFLIIGHKRNTKDDPGVWTDENGNRRDWDYVQEQVIASGDNEAELVASAKHYKKLCGMTMEQYLRSLVSPNEKAEPRASARGRKER